MNAVVYVPASSHFLEVVISGGSTVTYAIRLRTYFKRLFNWNGFRMTIIYK